MVSPNGVISSNASSAIVSGSGAATRYEKTDESDPAMIHLAATRFVLK
jgi:hypothetical protein